MRDQYIVLRRDGEVVGAVSIEHYCELPATAPELTRATARMVGEPEYQAAVAELARRRAA